ncbi:hypothetical protein WGU94_09820, partial [Campylobacter jejuni]
KMHDPYRSFTTFSYGVQCVLTPWPVPLKGTTCIFKLTLKGYTADGEGEGSVSFKHGNVDGDLEVLIPVVGTFLEEGKSA